MKHIAHYLHDYFHEQWNPQYFLSVGLLLAVSFAINYGFDFESTMLKRFTHPLEQFVFYVVFFGIPYFATLGLQRHSSTRSVVSDTRFLFLSVFCFILLSAYITLHNLPVYLLRTVPSLFDSLPASLHWYAIRYSSNLFPGFLVAVPLLLHWYLRDKSDSRFYGFSSSHINLKTYFVIIAFLAPLIFAVSYTPDFQSAYPRFKFGLPETRGGEQLLLIGGFELCYGIDFVFVEWLFRGFMVMAFARYLGSSAILPMVVVYAFIHFQKPIGEALSSIVGGLVLGVIAYRTKSIYGGIILHLGVAFLMELAGAMQQLF